MNTKIRCILLDDELPSLAYLKLMCQQLPELEIVKAYADPEKMLAELPDLDFDLCIMDIEMPNLNGLAVARLFDKKAVIFATAYKEYAADAFDIDAVDYVLKPINKDRLLKAVHKATDRILSERKELAAYLTVNTNRGKAFIYFDKLIFIGTGEDDKRDKLAILETGERLVIKNISFGKLLEALPEKQFCRVNKKEIVAIRIVASVNYDEITTTMVDVNGKAIKVALGLAYRKDFLNKMA